MNSREGEKFKTESELPKYRSDVDRAIFEIYGKDGWESFDELYKEHPDWPLEKVIKEFEANPVNTQTNFFRFPNLKDIADDIAKRVGIKEGKRNKRIEILEIGSSSGEESYSLAVHMLEAGNKKFHITAVDVNPDMVDIAKKGEYRLWHPISEPGAGLYDIRKEHFKKGYFEDSGKTWNRRYYIGPSIFGLKKQGLVKYYDNGGLIPLPDVFYQNEPMPIVQPTKRVKEKINFLLHDVIDIPVKGQFDIVLMNNVLNHYPEETRRKILKNVLASLKPGGFLVLEHTMGPMNDTEREWLMPYNEWREKFAEEFGLEEIGVKTRWSKEGETSETGEFFQYKGVPASA